MAKGEWNKEVERILRPVENNDIGSDWMVVRSCLVVWLV